MGRSLETFSVHTGRSMAKQSAQLTKLLTLVVELMDIFILHWTKSTSTCHSIMLSSIVRMFLDVVSLGSPKLNFDIFCYFSCVFHSCVFHSICALSGRTSYRKITWSRKIGCYNDRIILKFDAHLGNAAANVLVKFQNDWKKLKPNVAASRLHEILR